MPGLVRRRAILRHVDVHSRQPAGPATQQAARPASAEGYFSAHLWQPQLARQSRDRLFVNKRSADCDRRLRIGWLNVRSLANKTTSDGH